MKIVIYKDRNKLKQWQPFLPEVLDIIEVENYEKFVNDLKRNRLAISPREWNIVSLDSWKKCKLNKGFYKDYYEERKHV